MLPKTEKGKGLLFCFIQYPEVQKNISKKKNTLHEITSNC